MPKGVFVLFLLLVGCSTSGRVEPLANPDQSAVPDPGPYVENGDLVAGPPLPGLHFAPSEGDCAPAAQPLTFTACCGGQPCNGHCVYGDDGQSICSCFGEVGGCKPDRVCSKLRYRCVEIDEVDAD